MSNTSLASRHLLTTASALTDLRRALDSALGRSAVAATAALLAFGLRATGLQQANDLFIDELTYVGFADQINHGQLPNENGVAFFLHPPGSMALNAIALELFGPAPSTIDLVFDLRWVNACLGSVMVALSYLIVCQLVNVPAAVVSAFILTFDPFVLRNDTRVMIETPTVVFLLAGWLVLARSMNTSSPSARCRLDITAGILIGLAMICKDMAAIPGLLPVLAAAIWRNTLPPLRAVRIAAAAILPYAVYLVALSSGGLLLQWWTAKVSGVTRMIGINQITGFNSVSGVSLTGRLADELPRFGTSYLLLALCLPAGIVAARSQVPGRRLVGIIAVLTGLLGIYAVTAGAAEEQFGYYVAVTAALTLPPAVAELSVGPTLQRTAVGVCTLFTAATLLLGISSRLVLDDTFLQAKAWMEANLPPGTALAGVTGLGNMPADATVGVTGVTAEFAFPGFDISPSLAAIHENRNRYVLTSSRPISEGYGYAAPELLIWLDLNATPRFDAYGPSSGHTVLWQLDPMTVEKAVNAGTLIPPVG
jgi:hypothetical protein